jgi:hypothetical protein
VVQPNDTVFGIAKEHGIDVEDIIKWNNFDRRNLGLYKEESIYIYKQEKKNNIDDVNLEKKLWGAEEKYPQKLSSYFERFRNLQDNTYVANSNAYLKASAFLQNNVTISDERTLYNKVIDFTLLLNKAVGKAQAFIISPLLLIPRAPITNALDRGQAYATNLREVLAASMAQSESVELQGELIEMIRKDPDMMRAETEFIDRMKKDAGFIKDGKYKEDKGLSVQFGGSRGNGDGGWTVKGTASAFFNQLTWIIRNTTVMVTSVRNDDGTATITYSLTPDEKLDLRPNGSEVLYDVITIGLGYYYHDVFGGNDQLQVKATWTTTIKLEE